ncbi:MAG: hypothetical protein VB012_00850 [Erysipelotrichaceae bacterium]|nr:hypothetical protein [Erysipelotrichaceae bacterium]
MIEDFSDFLSIACLIVIILAAFWQIIKSYLQIRERHLIRKEIEYYKEV